ncbi:MAG: hypothetical protein E7179_04600 [Erysipelotrichaceae bacterium]|jgi:superfamily II DNA or RNA helicase|nr:hypothetical protein [Erysipelotrichaceae bacterium]
MYFLNKDEMSLLSLLNKANLSYGPIEKRIFDEAEIYFRLSEDGSLIYEALLNDGYEAFCLSKWKEVEPLTPKGLLLAMWVYQKEKGLGEDGLRAIYGELYDSLLDAASIETEVAESYLKAKASYNALLDKLSAKKPGMVTPSYELEWVFSNRYDEFRVDARIGSGGKLYMNRNMADFLSSYYGGRMAKVGSQYINLPRGSFSKINEEGLSLLSRLMGMSGHRYEPYASIPSPFMVDFAFLLIGEKVRLEERTVIVTSPIDITLSLKESGEFSLSYIPEGRGYLLLHEDKGLFLGSEAVEPLRFASPRAAELYKFVYEHQDFPFAESKKELSLSLLPLLEEDDVEVDPSLLGEASSKKPRIEAHISYEEGQGIKVTSSYLLGSEEVSPSTFSLNPIGRRMKGSYEAALNELGLGSEGIFSDEEALLNVLRSDLSSLSSTCTLYLDEALAKSPGGSLSGFHLEADTSSSWLSLTLHSDLFSHEELLSIYKAYRRKKKYVRVSGKLVYLEGNEPLEKLSESFELEELGKELPLYQALKLPELGSSEEGVKKLIESLTSYKELPLPKLSSSIEESARPYQKEGIRFLLNLYNLKMPGILSDEMGLGKSLQTVALLGQVKEDKPILVICPKSLLYNWADELSRWDPSIPCLPLVGSKAEREAIYAQMESRGKAVYFISYDSVRNDVEPLSKVGFSYLILDEAQYIANALAKKSQAVKSLRSEYRLALTGTPIQNSLLDLWSIFDFLMPGYFPPFAKFKSLYGSLELKGEEARKRLLAKIKPFMLGRKKKDVLKELPDKENLVVTLPLGEEQRKAYEAELSHARELLKQGGGAMVLLGALTRLRQICVSPSLYLEGDYESDKMDFLVQNLADLHSSSRKAVVFSSFASALHLLEKPIKKAGLVSATIEGETPAKIRVNLAKRFNESDDIHVLLVSLKAGGTGLNLVGADTVFHLDPWWNLAAERQAEDRTHRIGQKNKVTVYKLVCKDTIEEKVLALQKKKGLLGELTDEASMGRSLSEEDLAFLLS